MARLDGSARELRATSDRMELSGRTKLLATGSADPWARLGPVNQYGSRRFFRRERKSYADLTISKGIKLSGCDASPGRRNCFLRCSPKDRGHRGRDHAPPRRRCVAASSTPPSAPSATRYSVRAASGDTSPSRTSRATSAGSRVAGIAHAAAAGQLQHQPLAVRDDLEALGAQRRARTSARTAPAAPSPPAVAAAAAGWRRGRRWR